ncbi:hypothetical protein [Polaromonas sp.]|uniref:hypothetical protein n=1 Tax=Polaromonas sp. TaxID=1869339 RepID=UPI002FCB35E3
MSLQKATGSELENGGHHGVVVTGLGVRQHRSASSSIDLIIDNDIQIRRSVNSELIKQTRNPRFCSQASAQTITIFRSKYLNNHLKTMNLSKKQAEHTRGKSPSALPRENPDANFKQLCQIIDIDKLRSHGSTDHDQTAAVSPQGRRGL